MSYEISNISDISAITFVDDLSSLNTSDLAKVYSNYFLYVEGNDAEDEPYESQCQLYQVFDSGINIMSKDDWNIIVGENVTSHTQIICTNNYDKIVNMFGNIDNEIDYAGITDLLQTIDENDDYDTLVEKIYGWLNTIVDFGINENPEDADDSNLILTQGIKDIIQQIVEGFLNKIFRNLVQLIRARHEYRLYGPGATIFGGRATTFSTTQKIGSWSSLPPSCWVQQTGNYVVGQYAYDNKISNVGKTISHSSYNIGSQTLYGISPHIHQVTTVIDYEHTLSIEKYVYDELIFNAGTDADYIRPFLREALINKRLFPILCESWKKTAAKAFNTSENNIEAFIYGQPNKVSVPTGVITCETIWSSTWNSNNCKLLSSSTMKNDIFEKQNAILPTYSSYVWKWMYDDTETNITSPEQYI